MAHDWDCVVVGGGVAGLSAAMVLGRARRRTLVLDRDQQSNRAAAHVGGPLGHGGRPPGEIAERQVALLAGWTDDVTVVDPSDVTGVRVEDGVLKALVCRDGSEVPC